ncbi:MAG TPA: biopolymer transporter ExbD [Gemmataceae bacterium]|jgi:biopolymer transport protein ExbD|nr:biopolymer transporter ExbD [Gemmataceae bacterium]
MSTPVKADPNLVPLLDLVFQLIMFFMICVNFVGEQVNADIQLPTSQSARPMDKAEVDVLFLNLDAQGNVHVPGEPQPLTTSAAIQVYLRRQYGDAKRVAAERGDKTGTVKTSIIIRADRNATYLQVFNLMLWCRDVGYRKIEQRAYIKTEG